MTSSMDAYERQGRQAWIIHWIKHGFKMFRMYVFYIYIYTYSVYSIQYVYCLFVYVWLYIHALHYTTLHYITLHYITLHTYMYMGMGQNSVPLVNSKIAGNHPPTNDVYIHIIIHIYIYVFWMYCSQNISIQNKWDSLETANQFSDTDSKSKHLMAGT